MTRAIKAGDGQTHKVIRLVATSPHSWEDAARSGVREASKTIVDLESAEVTEMDVVVDGNAIRQYRVELEMVFQLDRSRRSAENEIVHVRRYLIVANQTLVSQALHELVDQRVAAGPVELHILAPRALESGASALLARIPSPGRGRQTRRHEAEREAEREAEERVELFRRAFSHLGGAVTGEVGDPDPVIAVQRVLERGSFDELVLSMLPPSASRLTRRDVVGDLERAVRVPVTALIHDEGDDVTSCPIG